MGIPIVNTPPILNADKIAENIILARFGGNPSRKKIIIAKIVEQKRKTTNA